MLHRYIESLILSHLASSRVAETPPFLPISRLANTLNYGSICSYTILYVNTFEQGFSQARVIKLR